MSEKTQDGFWRSYIRGRLSWIAGVLAVFMLFVIILWFEQIPGEVLLYPTLVCGVLFLVLLFFQGMRERRRYRQLKLICGMNAELLAEMAEMTEGMMEAAEMAERTELSLPPACSACEELYQELIRRLAREETELHAQNELKYQDMMDYFTVWVHQIKTPIAAMRLQLEEVDTGEARRLRGELNRIEQYVEMVLAYLRLDSESGDYVFRPVELDQVVRKALRRFSIAFIQKRIALDYEPLRTTVVTDEKWLRFVLEQVLSNALKYTSEGTVRIYMEPAADHSVLCIRDTGIGIAASDLPRIFEKGYTGFNGRIDQKASGLGLYLCRRVCGKIGAEISAESQVGQGTVIRLALPEGREVRD